MSLDSNGPCAGVRVLDFTTVVSGPLCTQALGDMGAEVIKVETLMGDMSRLAAQPLVGGLSGFFTQFNRNKRSLALDLKQEAGREEHTDEILSEAGFEGDEIAQLREQNVIA